MFFLICGGQHLIFTFNIYRYKPVYLWIKFINLWQRPIQGNNEGGKKNENGQNEMKKDKRHGMVNKQVAGGCGK